MKNGEGDLISRRRRLHRVDAGLALREAGVHSRFAFGRAVVPGAEQLVQGHEAVGVVHFEILMMEIVSIGVAVEAGGLLDLDLVETDITDNGAEARKIELIDRNDRVLRNDHMQENR